MAVIQVQCPNCGAGAEINNPAIVQITCEYCDTIFLWDKETIQSTGKKSRLMQALSGLAIGTTGKIRGRSFTVVGRVQYDYGEGVWDEWYCILDNGDTLWLSEDMGQLMLEKPVHEVADIEESAIAPGDVLTIEGQKFYIREVDRAQCKGTAGQLPFEIEPDETYRYADGQSESGRLFLTLEFDRKRGATAFIGVRLKSDEIEYEKAEKVIQKQAEIEIACPKCGSPLSLRGARQQIQTIVCESCGSLNRLEEDVAVALGLVSRPRAEVFELKLGDRGVLKGKEWTIVGRIRYDWREEDEMGYVLEYLLYHPDEGYRWLSEADGFYTWTLPVNTKPSIDVFKRFSVRRPFIAGNRRYRMFEMGSLEVTYVDGALPWEATIGDRILYVEGIAPPYSFTVERVIEEVDGKEQVVEEEYSLSEYIPVEDVEKAFQKKLPRPYGVAPEQPYVPLPREGLWKSITLIFALFLFSMAFVLSMQGRTLMSETWTVSDLLNTEKFSQPFEIKRAGETLKVTVSTGLSNEWVSLGIALVRKKGSAITIVADEDRDVQYYHGVEDGESWSEGSRKARVYWRLKDPGEYQLLVTAYESGASPGTEIRISVKAGVYRTYPIVIVGFFWFLTAFGLFYRKWSFESRRWKPVLEDDED